MAATTDLASKEQHDLRVPAVSAEQLRWRCDPEQLGLASTEDVPPLAGTVGQ
jgi:hypothetical protein